MCFFGDPHKKTSTTAPQMAEIFLRTFKIWGATNFQQKLGYLEKHVHTIWLQAKPKQVPKPSM